MFDVPGFNPVSMSDDELMNRQYELNRRLSWAARFSGSDMSSQLLAMISAIEMERRDRLLKVVFSERQKMFPDIIETEPDLAAEHKRKIVDAEKDDQMSERRRVGRERVTLKKTAQPTPIEPQLHVQREEIQDEANSSVDKDSSDGRQ
jgi:hypothetical protein